MFVEFVLSGENILQIGVELKHEIVLRAEYFFEKFLSVYRSYQFQNRG